MDDTTMEFLDSDVDKVSKFLKNFKINIKIWPFGLFR